MVLRFRDLVTEKYGTVLEHLSIIKDFGGVWWGWWSKQHESRPLALFADLDALIKERGPSLAFLFDSGSGLIYETDIARIALAPPGMDIACPEPKKAPSYYQRGRYPAWFYLKRIEQRDLSALGLVLLQCPTNPAALDGSKRGLTITQPDQLRDINVTIWLANLQPASRT